ncbi:MAG: KEOPS complex subunit Cgi121 [Candidatus Diapherotrites archaeon]|nr:KEOPS complex subunit Cgi121 [Candidatus Diapherotrites archaeon]
MARKKIFLLLSKTTSDLNSLMPKINKCLSYYKKDVCFVAIVPANSILSRRQILSAAEKSIESFCSKQRFSKKLDIEFLLYLYGKTKIDEAIKIANSGKRDLLIAISEKKSFIKCLKKEGLGRRSFSLKPKIAEMKKIYSDAIKHIRGKLCKNELELAVIEMQTMLLARTCK